jgi:hypothetical protein
VPFSTVTDRRYIFSNEINFICKLSYRVRHAPNQVHDGKTFFHDGLGKVCDRKTFFGDTSSFFHSGKHGCVTEFIFSVAKKLWFAMKIQKSVTDQIKSLPENPKDAAFKTGSAMENLQAV